MFGLRRARQESLKRTFPANLESSPPAQSLPRYALSPTSGQRGASPQLSIHPTPDVSPSNFAGSPRAFAPRALACASRVELPACAIGLAVSTSSLLSFLTQRTSHFKSSLRSVSVTFCYLPSGVGFVESLATLQPLRLEARNQHCPRRSTNALTYLRERLNCYVCRPHTTCSLKLGCWQSDKLHLQRAVPKPSPSPPLAISNGMPQWPPTCRPPRPLRSPPASNQMQPACHRASVSCFMLYHAYHAFHCFLMLHAFSYFGGSKVLVFENLGEASVPVNSHTCCPLSKVLKAEFPERNDIC